jgi:hypothetical protein
MSLATILRRVALALTSLFVVGGLLFALGYAFEDPGGWTAGIISAAVVVPLVGLTVLAARAAPLALKVLAAGVVVFAVWGLVTLFVDFDLPDIPAVALVLALPIAVVGQRYATRAGELMLGVAAVPLVLVVVRLITERGPEGPGLGALLGGSTGVVVVPLVVLAVLLLGAGAVGRTAATSDKPRVQPPTPAARG